MFNEADKNISSEEKLNKFIEQKSNEIEALKKLLDQLQKESETEIKINQSKNK